jgi:hypothetical protein
MVNLRSGPGGRTDLPAYRYHAGMPSGVLQFRQEMFGGMAKYRWQREETAR